MRVIVVGNEKGGSGKSTTAVHLSLGLVQLGFRVVVIDVDSRQRTLARFMAYRADYAETHGLLLPVPECRPLAAGGLGDRPDADAEAERCLSDLFDEFDSEVDQVVIDCPGSDTAVSRAAHGRADVLVTPINDSFVDLDVLADVDADTFGVLRPGRYSAMVWEQKKRRALRDRAGIDWIVMRNRLAHLDARNMRRVDAALAALAPRVGFRVAPGFSERVIYRELFPRGLTVLDIGTVGMRMTMSHVGARNEVRGLLAAVLRDTVSPAPLPAAGTNGAQPNL